MFCGSRSFSRVDDQDPRSPAKPRGSRRNHVCGNPFAGRGIDKFSMVLADLQAMRDKVMAREGASLVRFVYSGSHDWIPIVVKVPPREQPQPAEKPRKCSPAGAAPQRKSDAAVDGAAPNREVVLKRGSTCRKVRGKFVEGRGWHPSYYWPAVVVALILLCLVFGRSFAICCTSVGWYLLPSISGGRSLDERKSTKKEEYRGRRSRWELAAARVR